MNGDWAVWGAVSEIRSLGGKDFKISYDGIIRPIFFAGLTPSCR